MKGIMMKYLSANVFCAVLVQLPVCDVEIKWFADDWKIFLFTLHGLFHADGIHSVSSTWQPCLGRTLLF